MITLKWNQIFNKLFSKSRGLSGRILDNIEALGYQHYHHDEFELASEMFRYLCLYQPDDINHFISLGICELKSNRYQTALYVLNRARMLQSKPSPEVLFYLALTLLMLGEDDLAQPQLQEAAAFFVPSQAL